MNRLKRCAKCRAWKDREHFRRKAIAKDGLASHCKRCCCAYDKTYRQNNKDKIRKYKRTYRHNNKDKIREHDQTYRLTYKRQPRKSSKGFNIPGYIALCSIEGKECICQTCGKTRDLLIHHIDLDSTNHATTNLIVICRSCHAVIHSSRPQLLPPYHPVNFIY